MSDTQAAQRDDSPMDVDQPSPLEQDPAPLGKTHFHTDNSAFHSPVSWGLLTLLQSRVSPDFVWVSP